MYLNIQEKAEKNILKSYQNVVKKSPTIGEVQAILKVKLVKGEVSHSQFYLANLELQDRIEKKELKKAEWIDVKVTEELIKGGEGSKGGDVIGHTRSGKAIYKDGKHSNYKDFHQYDHEEAGYHHSQLSDMHRQKSNAHETLARVAEHSKDKEEAKTQMNHKAESDKKELHHAAHSRYHFEESRPNHQKERESKMGKMVGDIRNK